MENYRLLVIDDAFFVRNLIKKAISNKPKNDAFNISVIGDAKNADEAISFCKTEVPDIITVDYQMPPGINGLELVKELKKQYSNIKILMIADTQDVESEAKKLNCQFLMKPFKEEILWNAIDHLILDTQNELQSTSIKSVDKEITAKIEISEDKNSETSSSNTNNIEQSNDLVIQKKKKKKKKKKKSQNTTTSEFDFGFEIAGSLTNVISDTKNESTEKMIMDTGADQPTIQIDENELMIDDLPKKEETIQSIRDDTTSSKSEIQDLTVQSKDKSTETEKFEDTIIVDESIDESEETVVDKKQNQLTNDDDYYVDEDEDVFTFHEEDESEYEDEEIDKFKADSITQNVKIDDDSELTEDEELAALIQEASYSIDEQNAVVPEKNKKSALDLLKNDSDIFVDLNQQIDQAENKNETDEDSDFDSMLEKYEKSETFKNAQNKSLKEREFEDTLDDLDDAITFTLDDLDDEDFDLNDANESIVNESENKSMIEQSVKDNNELTVDNELYELDTDADADEDADEDLYFDDAEDFEDIPDEISITDAKNTYELLHADEQTQTSDARTNENNRASSLEDFEDYFDIEEDDNIPIYDTEEMPVSEIIKRNNEQYHKTNDFDILPPEPKLKNQIKPKNGRPDGTNVKQKQSFFGRFFKK